MNCTHMHWLILINFNSDPQKNNAIILVIEHGLEQSKSLHLANG